MFIELQLLLRVFLVQNSWSKPSSVGSDFWFRYFVLFSKFSLVYLCRCSGAFYNVNHLLVIYCTCFCMCVHFSC